MNLTNIFIAVIIAVFAYGTAALMHALVAAFEQIPYAQERELALKVRPDGSPSSAAILAQNPHAFFNKAAISYAIFESLATLALVSLFWRINKELGYPAWAVFLFLALLITVVSLWLVRALPRRLGRNHPRSTINSLSPFVRQAFFFTGWLARFLPQMVKPALSEAEDLVEQAQEALDEEDAEMLRSVVELGDTLTREVMVPRTDMVTINLGTPLRKAQNLFMKSGFSRVPVIGENIDDVQGIIYLKDVVKATWDNPEKLQETVETLMRQPAFIPEGLPVDELLRGMQKEKNHMALVVDEYGGISGLVTIEDALEEIVGELDDEHDQQSAPEVEEISAGVYRVSTRLPVDDLAEIFNLEIAEDDVDTVGGLLAKALGKVPLPGSRATVNGLNLVADRAEGRRRILSTIIVTEAESEND